jgi:hypothetical protein
MPALAQEAAAPERLSTLIPALMRAVEVPGLSIAVIKSGKARWIGSFGVFPAASLGKVAFRVRRSEAPGSTIA